MKTVFVLPQGQFTPLQEISIYGLISAGINLLLITASILFVFSLLLGGIKYIISFGNKDKVDVAKRQLLNALIGITIVFSSWAIMNFLSIFWGINLLSFQIPTF